MKTIFLIGFMGSGKSTVAEKLAESLSKVCVDTDEYIEKKHGEVIPEIFKKRGEKVFRSYETEALKEVSNFDVISTGGGIVEYDENFKTMKKNGSIVYLQTSFDEVARRLKNDTTRPLWSKDQVEKIALYKKRIPMYEEYSDYTINTDNKTIEEIVNKIRGVLSRD